MNDLEWLKKQLNNILSFDEIIEDNALTNEYGSYTALKLIAVHYTADVFSRVARHDDRKVEGFGGAVYVDLFAGTGIVTLKDTNDIIAGSAPCALMNRFGFDYCVLVEKDEEKCKNLKRTISKIPNVCKFDVINGDCNEVIGDVLNKISINVKNPIILAFIDPEGLEIKFETLMALSDKFQNCDFLINFSSSGVSRVAGIARGNKHDVTQILSSLFYKDPELLSELEKKTPVKKYVEQVQEILDKKKGDIIPIYSSGNRIVYHLLCYTRQTRGGSGYINAFSDLKKKMKHLDRKLVIDALDQIRGRSSSLDDF